MYLSDNVSAVYEPPEPAAKAAQEVPGFSQAAPFTACRASERSERGVTPSVLSDLLWPGGPAARQNSAHLFGQRCKLSNQAVSRANLFIEDREDSVHFREDWIAIPLNYA